jgi:hypothetical protein
MTTTYNGEAFIKALAENALHEPIIKTGMAKRVDGATDAFLFTEGSCAEWVRIPLSLVDEVTYLSTGSCHDHHHPVVKIRFKQVPEKNEAATVFAALARTAELMPHYPTASYQPAAYPTGMPPKFSPMSGGCPGSGMVPMEMDLGSQFGGWGVGYPHPQPPRQPYCLVWKVVCGGRGCGYVCAHWG